VAQGWLYSPAVPAADLEEVLRRLHRAASGAAARAPSGRSRRPARTWTSCCGCPTGDTTVGALSSRRGTRFLLSGRRGCPGPGQCRRRHRPQGPDRPVPLCARGGPGCAGVHRAFADDGAAQSSNEGIIVA
jgi:hypothetical protein